jgi:hypothetical protein
VEDDAGVRDAAPEAAAHDAAAEQDAAAAQDAAAERDAAAAQDAAAHDDAAEQDAAAEHDATAADPDLVLPDSLVPGWAVRKRVRSKDGVDVVLEERLSSFVDELPGAARLRMLMSDGSASFWNVPSGARLSDFCLHPSGAMTAILIAPDRTVSLERLSPSLTPIGTLLMRDPLLKNDPHVTDDGDLDLKVNGLARDAAHVAAVDEAIVAVVDTSWNSVIAYRSSISNGLWTEPARTLIEPPAPITKFLPTGGTFDTFDAMFATFRSVIDVDDVGNVYVASWASPRRIKEHVAAFKDGLVPLPPDPSFPGAQDSDVLVSKLDRSGARQWSTVVGSLHEDDIYGIRVHAGMVAVVGRARRFVGFDNTFWDAFVSIVSTEGEFDATRVLQLDASSIFLAVDALPTGGWVLAGSDGWAQNPSGLSVLSFGNKLLATLPSLPGLLTRISLPAGPRHNQLRTVVAERARIWFAGHEDGPIMHTGDGDKTQIFSTGVLGSVRFP